MKPSYPRHHRVFRYAGLAVSAVALAGLVQLQSVWAHPDEDDVDLAAQTVDERDGVLEPEQMLAIARTPAQISAAVAGMPTAERQPDTREPPKVSPESPEPAEPETVAVPELTTLGVHKAVKALNEVGLKVRVRDESGWRLPAEEWRYYRVQSQKVEAGKEVLPGSRIALVVEWDPKKLAAQGY